MRRRIANVFRTGFSVRFGGFSGALCGDLREKIVLRVLEIREVAERIYKKSSPGLSSEGRSIGGHTIVFAGRGTVRFGTT